MMYSKVCDNGHEGETLSVEAGNDEEAMGKMMEAVKAHLAEKHQEMTMSEEEMKTDIMNSWTKSDGAAQA